MARSFEIIYNLENSMRSKAEKLTSNNLNRKVMKIIFAAFSLMILFLPSGLRAQIKDADKTDKNDKTLVSVPVAVSDRDGRYISDLKKKDFTVFEDGVEQKIAFFSTFEEPLNIALLLDTSGSTEFSLDDIKSAARDFIDLLNADDKCLIATFDSEVKVLNPFTNDRKVLKDSLYKARTAAEDGTVMFRAVEQVAQNSFNDVSGRKVIVLLSDGKDSGNFTGKDILLGKLEESDVLIYTIFYKTGAGFNKIVIDPTGEVKEGKEDRKAEKEAEKKAEKTEKPKSAKKKKNYTIFIPAPAGATTDADIEALEKNADRDAVDALKAMSDATAGRFYLSDTPKLNSVFKQVAAELRQQYRLGYKSSKPAVNDSEVRSISVSVSRPDVVVRARGKFRAKQL